MCEREWVCLRAHMCVFVIVLNALVMSVMRVRLVCMFIAACLGMCVCVGGCVM